MFGWFKSDKSSKHEKAASDYIAAKSTLAVPISNDLYFATKEVLYKSIDPDGGALESQARLLQLNTIMGADPELSFSGIQYDQLLIAMSHHDTNGTLGIIAATATGHSDKVISAILNAAMYEMYMKKAGAQSSEKNLLNEIRSSAEYLLSLLNIHSSTKRKSDPSVRLGSSNS